MNNDGGYDMNRKVLNELASQLRRRRSSLLEGVAGSQQATTAIIEERESEIEENAQKERLARLTSRLTDRDQHAIREINAALARIDDGTYGQCAWCESEIKPERLRALPTAILCIDCATAREKRQRSIARDRESDRLLVSDRELDSDVDIGN
jgi:DnaK suppressor protein